MPEPPVPAERRPASIAPAARERVVERLTHLFADDLITQDDLEARLDRVYHAASGAELDAIVADLPAPVAEATAVTAHDTARPRVAALLSAVERQWMGVVPRHLEVRGRLGYVELDLTGATFEPGVTVIDVRAFMGYVQLRLPAGVRVECLGRAFAGFFAMKGAARAGATASPSVVQIVGRAAFGFAECFVASDPTLRLPGRAE
jgi:hypothetical protein